MSSYPIYENKGYINEKIIGWASSRSSTITHEKRSDGTYVYENKGYLNERLISFTPSPSVTKKTSK